MFLKMILISLNTFRSLILLFLILFFNSIYLYGSNPPDDDLRRIKYNNKDLVVDLGVGLWAWPIPIDYDNDGDNDLLVNCPDKPYNGIYFFENTQGNIKSPIFKPGLKISPAYKNIQPSYSENQTKFLIPGKEIIDLNKGTSKKIYEKDNVHTEVNKIRANQWKYCDYNGNGVLDLIVSVGDWSDYGWDNAYDEEGNWIRGPLHGYLYLIKNLGTTENPLYAKPEKIKAYNKPIDVYGMPSANFADFDNDGDLDILCGEFLDKFTYFQNIGSRSDPKYDNGKYLTFENEPLKMDLQMIVPVAFDWDKDGDFDIVVGQEDGRVALVENTGKIKNNIPQFLLPEFFKQEADEVKFGALITPYNIDWDKDGDDDLICGNTAGYIGYIENIGNGEFPKWNEPVYLKADDEIIRIQAGYNGSIQGPCEAKWGYTTLSVGDWNFDGLNDIVVNSIWGKIVWYENIGDIHNPRLAQAKPVKIKWKDESLKPNWFWWNPEKDNFVTQWRTTPFVIDWNSDGLLDLVMLDHEGFLAFFERIKLDDDSYILPGQKIFYNEHGEELQLNPRIAGKSGRRKFTFSDWDLDGKIDLLVNGKNVNFFKNISETENKVVLKDMGMVSEKIIAGHSTSPTIVNWDKNDIPDLLIGAEDGYLYFLKNPNDKN